MPISREQQRAGHPPQNHSHGLPTFLPALIRGALRTQLTPYARDLTPYLRIRDRLARACRQPSPARPWCSMSAMLRRDSEISPIEFAARQELGLARVSARAWQCCLRRASCRPWPRSAGRWRARGCCGTACRRRTPRRRCGRAGARVRMTSTWSLGRISRPTPVSSLMRVEMARMPAGRIAASTPPSPALDQLERRDRLARQHRRAGDGAVKLLDRVRAVRSFGCSWG